MVAQQIPATLGSGCPQRGNSPAATGDIGDPLMVKADFRFYEELNDFLVRERRKRSFGYACPERATVKHAIEALGVPHTEVEIILVNGRSVGFSYVVQEGDRISVYPQFESLDVSSLLRLRSQPLRRTRFVADAHLGALAKYLRMLGFDTVFDARLTDAELAVLSAGQQRVLLSRDRDLLMHRVITHGCYIRARDPRTQLREIVDRLDLYRSINAFTRCMQCNAVLRVVPKCEVLARLPENTEKYHERFAVCTACDKVYWEGSHHRCMTGLVEDLLARSSERVITTG